MTSAELARHFSRTKQGLSSRFELGLSFALGVGLALLLVLAMGSDPTRLQWLLDAWFVVATVLTIVFVFSASTQLYWRNDTPFLVTFPLQSIQWYLAHFRFSLRRLFPFALIVAPPLVVLYPFSMQLTLWLVLPLLASIIVSVPLAYLGGVLAWKEANANVLQASGVPPAPRAFLVGILPAIWLATTIGSIVLTYGEPVSVIYWGSFCVASLAVSFLALGLHKHMHPVTASVLQFDRQILAHIEAHPPTATESLALKLTAPNTRSLARKDFQLLRRKVPIWYLIGVCGSVGASLAYWRSSTLWTCFLAGALFFSAFQLYRESRRPPTEYPFVQSLPFAPPSIPRGKRTVFFYAVILWGILPSATAVLTNFL